MELHFLSERLYFFEHVLQDQLPRGLADDFVNFFAVDLQVGAHEVSHHQIHDRLFQRDGPQNSLEVLFLNGLGFHF